MLTGKGLADFGKSKKGMPYFYGSKIPNGPLTETYMALMHKYYPGVVSSYYIGKARRQGQVGRINVDCSGLISGYTNRVLGSAQLYQQAYTRLPMVGYKDWADGVVCWRSGHVGIFFKENGIYYVAEAKGIDYGVVVSEFVPSKWTCGLTFSWLDYSYQNNLSYTGTWKGNNPYKEPDKVIKKGSKDKAGESAVRWVQWELREAGFDREFTYAGKTYSGVVVDGVAGKITDAAIRAFQSSCKITVDGLVGPVTRLYFKE